jgi:hypothetical protein
MVRKADTELTMEPYVHVNLEHVMPKRVRKRWNRVLMTDRKQPLYSRQSGTYRVPVEVPPES